MADIDGTSGNDTLTGTAGSDDIDANAGDDLVSGGGGDDRVRGREGDDTLYGDAGDDEVEGDEGADFFLVVRAMTRWTAGQTMIFSSAAGAGAMIHSFTSRAVGMTPSAILASVIPERPMMAIQITMTLSICQPFMTALRKFRQISLMTSY